MDMQIPLKKRRGRPPKTDSTSLETKERLIRHGTAILTEKGFASTGIDEILKAVGVPKGSFYHYFSSKDDFGLILIENYGTYFGAKLDKWFLNEERDPLDRIHDFIDDAKRGMERFDFKRGCLIGNLGQELGALSDTFREPLENIFIDWQDRLEACLELAKAKGQLADHVDIKEQAACFWICWEGAILRAKLSRSLTPIDIFSASFFVCITKSMTTNNSKN
jgi:TetR/AcrR family transcriptional regulator, transcriptional repressor for nem operon